MSAAALAAPLAGGLRPPRAAAATASTLAVKLQNNTGSDTVYAYVTGQALDNGNALMLLEADGQTPYYPASPAATGSPLAVNCAISLGPSGGAPAPGHDPVPGRRPDLVLDRQPPGVPAQPRPRAGRAVGHQPVRPSIGLQWDFCELTYNDAQLFANISFVDFVCIPVALTLTGSAGTQSVPGLPGGGLDTVCAGLAA
ncbi:MAG: beta-1,3-glucanase family protein [Streptosporangiaceae bacterium]